MTMDHHLLRIINFCSVVLLLPHVTVISFAPPRSIAPLSYVGQRGQRMQWRRRENKATNDEDTSDFVNNISRQLEEEEKARQFTRQFYKELEYRQNRLSEFEWNVETYNVRGNFVDETGAQGRTHTNRTGFKSNTSTTNSNRRIFANQSPKRPSLSQSNPPISFPSFPPFFSFPIFPSPTTAPATSAGLFSGAGATVYSSGGTRRADIEILELTMKNDELKSRDNFSWKAIYLGNPEQIEHATKFIVGSLILLSAVYFAVGMSGASIEGTLVVDLSMIDGAVSGAKEASAIVEDILEGAAGSVIAGVGKAGEGICWLEEPAALAGSVVEVFSRSVEKLLIGAYAVWIGF